MIVMKKMLFVMEITSSNPIQGGQGCTLGVFIYNARHDLCLIYDFTILYNTTSNALSLYRDQLHLAIGNDPSNNKFLSLPEARVVGSSS